MNILDLLFILIVIIVAALSAQKGFLFTLFNIFAYIISWIGSRTLAYPLSESIYNNYINERIISALYEIMPSGNMIGSFSDVMEKIFDSLPAYVTAFINQFDIFPDNIIGGSEYADFSVEMIENNYLHPIVTNIILIVLNVLLFVLFSVILKIVLNIINNIIRARNHGILSKTNTFLGAVLGMVKGFVPSGLICALLAVLAPVINNDVLSELVGGSYFCKIISNILS